jgi:microcystin-dependent protein
MHGQTAFNNSSIPITLAASDIVEFDFDLPISEWANQGAVSALSQNTQSPIKAGIIMPFAGAVAPTGWLLGDGSVYLKTQYPQLYASIGDTWATCTNPLTGSAYSAPASDSFRVPDLRGSFLRGEGTFSDGIGTNTTLAGYQADQMQGHKHASTVPASGASAAVVATTPNAYFGEQNTGVPITDGTNGTPRTGKETRPRNVGVKYIIKAWDESFNLAGFAEATATSMGLVQGGRLPGSVSGAAIETGKVGENPGTLSSGTGGFTNKTTTTTNWTSTPASLVSQTLNKGVYIVSAGGKFTGAGSAGNASFNLRVGGTAVTSTFQGQYAASGEYAYSTPAVPVVISADATAVALWGAASGTSAYTVNDLYIVRIA